MKKLIPIIAAAAALVLAPIASASTIHTPADGATYQTTDTVYFDWAWGSDEYATAWIGLARSPDGPWSPHPEKTLMDCSDGFCSPFLSSHDYVPASSIGVGTWWWRLCNHSIYIEDDKCVLSSEAPRMLTITAPPAPVVTPPAPIVTPPAPPRPPLPAFTRAAAIHDLKAALLRKHSRSFNTRTFAANCVRWTRTSFHCWPSWTNGRTHFSGTARVWLTPNTGQHHVSERISQRSAR